jgi:hypothetical protein
LRHLEKKKGLLGLYLPLWFMLFGDDECMYVSVWML